MRRYLPVLVIVLVISCKKETAMPTHFLALMEIPKGFPEVIFPEGNEFTEARWQLGKKLFFDPIMSIDSSISCGSCHAPELAFSDDKAFSPGVENRPGVRNSPTLANVAYHPYLLREGGVPTLEMQVLVPIQEHNEFDFNIVKLAEQLADLPTYVEMSEAAYNRLPDPFVITRSLATFERSLLSGNSRFDQFNNGDDFTALSEKEQAGKELFFGNKTNCSKCHGGFNFTNYSFENNGLYDEYVDSGRLRHTKDSSDLALFKTPTLRNVEVTAPYMHDGSFLTLEEVVEHYNSGGKNHPNKSDLIQPLLLSESEKENLVAFLKALTDDSFLNNPIFK